MKFTLTTVVALFAAQALASAVAQPVAGDHDHHDMDDHKCHHDTITKTVTEYKWRHPKTETETTTVYRHKKVWKTTTVYSTTTKKWCPKKW